MSAQDETIQVGQVLGGRHRIISEGVPHDFGMLYKVYDMRRDQMAEALIIARTFGSGVEVLDRVVRTNRAVKDLQQSKLIAFEHTGLVNGQVFLVRDQVVGYPLADLLAQEGSMDLEEAVDIATRLCETLMPLHRAGMVHGGLSPRSVLVRVESQNLATTENSGSSPQPLRSISVLDVGLLPALRSSDAPPAVPWGRFPYLSPEQAAGEDIHPGSDVYVIGSLLYEMLSGRPPFRSSDEMVLALQHLRQDPPSLQVLVPRAPQALIQIVQKALAKEPAIRYRNTGQLAYILHAQVPHLASSQLTAQPQPPTQGRLVVPPPPVPPPVAAVPTTQVVYDDGTGDDYKSGGAGDIDWVLVGLIVVALVAVLGLILLWRTVYERYTVPPQMPTSLSYPLPDPKLPLASHVRLLHSPLTAEDPTRLRSEHAARPETGLRAAGRTWGCSLLDFAAAVASHGPELAQDRLFCYNPELPKVTATGLVPRTESTCAQAGDSTNREGRPGHCCVKILPVWESSLRVFGPKCTKL